MNITNKFIMSKTGNQETCEDIIFANDNFAAVIDGATSRDGAMYSGKSSGQIAAGIVRDSLHVLDKSASLKDTLGAVTYAFIDFYKANNIDINDYSKRLTASSVILSVARGEIWMVGDCQCMVDGVYHSNPNGIDEHVAAVRSLINQAEILKGKSVSWVAKNDPGAAFIRPLLTEQFMYQNIAEKIEGGFAYCAFDGMKIDPARVKVIAIDQDTKEIVFASDGYPALFDTLQESEADLKKLLENDALCIYENKCVKGIKPGNISFDDRAYLRFLI